MSDKEAKGRYTKQKSKDDLDQRIQEQRLDTARKLYEKELKEKTVAPSIFARAVSYLNDRLIVQPVNLLKSSISMPFNSAMSFINPVLENPIFQIATSTPASRVVTTALGAMAVTTAITVGTLPTAITGVVGGFSVVAVGAATVIDIKKVAALKKLEKEYNLLVKYRNAKNKQNYLLEMDPNLSIALKDELFIPQKNSFSRIDQSSGLTSNPKTVILSNMGSIGGTIETRVSVLSGNLSMYSLIYSSVMTGYSLISSSMSMKQAVKLQNAFQLAINDEINKDDTPIYDKNLSKLEAICRRQMVQTESITQLLTSENYWQSSREEKKEKYQEIKSRINETKGELPIPSRIDDIKDLVTATMQANNPFYKKPVKEDVKTPLSKAVEKDIKKPTNVQVSLSVKQKLQKNLSEPNDSSDTKKHINVIQDSKKNTTKRHSL